MAQPISQFPTANRDLPLPGFVRPDELYTLSELKRRLGVTDATLRAARRAGLQVYYKHKHGFVYGADWIHYILGTNKHLSEAGN